jgi:serine/threonine-protein kinase
MQPGTVLGRRYEIQQVLGAGGMGMVLKAYDRELDETVAVKVLRADLAGSEDIARRFRTEIKLARRVRHHNVCGIHEYGSEGGVSYIAMEFIEGTDLKHLIKQKGALHTVEAFDVCIQMAEGLQAIHDAGIIHRDLKTSNAMLDPKGRVALMDFGIAKDTQQGLTVGATAIGQVIGTPEYMSPEQARGEKIDARSDLYALGIIIFEVFSGHVPFQGTTPIATIFKTIEEPPPLEGERAAGIPRSVIPILAKVLAKHAAERFQSAREMAEALRAARAEIVGGPLTPAPGAGSFDVASNTMTSVDAPGSRPTLVTPAPSRTIEGSAATVGPLPKTLAPTRTPTVRTPARPVRVAPGRRQGVAPGVVVGIATAAAAVLLVAGWLVAARLGRVGSASPTPDDPTTVTSTPAPPPTLAVAPSPVSIGTVPVPPPTAPPPTAPPQVPTPWPATTLASVPQPTPRPQPTVSFAPLVTLAPSTLRPTPSASASLQVRVVPWAEVRLDDRVVGTTPFAPLTLKPGPHSLEFVHPDFKPVRRKVTLSPGQTLKIDLDMALDAVPK